MFLLVLMPGTCCPGLRVSQVAGGASPVIFARAPVLGRCGDFMVNNRIESLLAGLKTSPYQEAVLFGLQSNQQLLCTLYLLFCTFICTLYIVPVKIISSLPLSSGGDSLPPSRAPGKGIVVVIEQTFRVRLCRQELRGARAMQSLCPTESPSHSLKRRAQLKRKKVTGCLQWMIIYDT